MLILAGIVAAALIVGLGMVTRQARALSFYSTVLIVIALVYVLFASQTGTLGVVAVESVVAAGFVAVAVVGARWRSVRRAGVLLAAGLVAHGLFDLVHDPFLQSLGLQNPTVPAWWPVFCAVVDVVLGVGLGAFVLRSPASIRSADDVAAFRPGSLPASHSSTE